MQVPNDKPPARRFKKRYAAGGLLGGLALAWGIVGDVSSTVRPICPLLPGQAGIVCAAVTGTVSALPKPTPTTEVDLPLADRPAPSECPAPAPKPPYGDTRWIGPLETDIVTCTPFGWRFVLDGGPL